jgi:branched-chain amino acid aminotransferase
MESMKIYIDGQLYAKDEAKISVFDHGFLYGDGVFEGMRVYNRRIFRHDGHIERLFRSCKAIMIEPPLGREELKRAVEETVAANEIEDGYIRLIFSRGVGDLGLDPRKCAKPSTVIIAGPIALYPPEVYEKGMEVVTVSTRRSRPDVLNPAIKSLNYLNNILAKIEANRAGVPECIMLNDKGLVSECSADNLFIYIRDFNGKGQLRTPPVSAGILEGITRDAVMQVAEELGIGCVERDMALFDVYAAEEVFMTGSGAEVVPVTMVDSRQIGSGAPGEITKRIMARYHELTRSEGNAVW